MTKVLLPIDGSERALKAISYVKTHFKPEEADITLLMIDKDLLVTQIQPGYDLTNDYAAAEQRMAALIQQAAGQLEGYRVERLTDFGDPGAKIVSTAKALGTDVIVMTKSTRKGWQRMIGSVCAYVVKHAPCSIVIVPEDLSEADEA